MSVRKLLVAALLPAAAMVFRVQAQATFMDDFATPVNYLANGVAGTMWDGIYLGAGEIANATGVGAAAGTVSVADADISSNHVLTILSLQTDWENTADDGVFLFKVITGDFDMSVQVIGPTDAGAYNLPGLMVRAFGPGGAPSPGGQENSFLWARFDWLNYVNMLKNNVNGVKTDTPLGTAPNTNYWLRVQRIGDTFNLFEKALETDPWSQVGSVTRADFSGIPLQVGIEQSDYAGGATRTAQYANFNLNVSNMGPFGAPPAPVTDLAWATNATGGLVLSWTPGGGSAGSLAAMWTGSAAVKEAPANGFTYNGNAVYSLGDTLPTTNYFVVYSGSSSSVTVSNLLAGTNYHVAVFAYAGAGSSIVYNHSPATGSFSPSIPPTPPLMARAEIHGADMVIACTNTEPGKWYQVQWTASLESPDWQPVELAAQHADDLTMTMTLSNAASAPQRFYRVQQMDLPPAGRNLAVAATPQTSSVSSWETLSAINDGFVPANSADHSHGAYGNWPETGVQWVEYDWPVPINTDMIDVYWWQDNAGIYAPASCSLEYWDGTNYVPVSNPSGLGVALDQFNTTTFDPVTTTRLRLLFQSDASGHSTGILEWRVYDAGGSPTNFPPVVNAGIDRDVIVGGNTWLRGSVQDDGAVLATPTITWNKLSGPGTVTFSNANDLSTTASFSAPGAFVLQLSAYDGQYTSTGTVNVAVAPAPPPTHLLPVYVTPYSITSPLWRYRLNRTLTNWIPHLFAELNNTSNSVGNINSFIQAGNKLAGRAYTVPSVDPWADAYTLNTVEAMCYALMYDAQGDPVVIAAQNAFRTNLNYWVPIILGAQESDGYLHTYSTLRGLARWSNNSLHEGYVGGYFIEAALAHYLMTGRTDPTMFDAAKKLADCWYTNLYVPRKLWFDGHENMEQALVHLGRFMNEYEGAGTGDKYITLAKYLMDTRGTAAANAALGDGNTYDQSQAPVTQQYEVVGHAVRAMYLYSGMEDAAMETGDVDYQSAALSLWDNLVNKKYYVTGGVGSGETSEGFGNNYSLPNNSYCETCAGCGTLFFFHKLNLAYQDAKYADLMENVLYNEILGSLDDAATTIFYPNPLTGGTRAAWTGVPCCYGNAARTLFEMPTWIYARSSDAIYVNLFIGSTVSIPAISGTTVQMVQTTDYPWTNRVSIVVNPAMATNFTLNLREPDRTWSQIYTPTPAISGFTSIELNGAPISPVITNGYATITRTWTAGDTIGLVLPMTVQRIKASPMVAADAGLVALQYGPLIYNIESVDQNTGLVLSPAAPLSVQYTNILGGFLKITGAWTNGAALTAIPNYARLNRGGSSAVWFRDQ
jgi:uncharacterized protein